MVRKAQSLKEVRSEGGMLNCTTDVRLAERLMDIEILVRQRVPYRILDPGTIHTSRLIRFAVSDPQSQGRSEPTEEKQEGDQRGEENGVQCEDG